MPITQKLVAGVIVFNTNLDVLVLEKRKNRAADLPKGLVEPGETLYGAALRECEEETGLSAEDGGFVIRPDIFIDVYSKSFVRLYLGVYEFNFVHLSEEHLLHYWLDIDFAIDAFESGGNPDFADAIDKMYSLVYKEYIGDQETQGS